MIKFGIMFFLAGIIIFIAALAQIGQNRSYAASSGDVTGTVLRKDAHQKKNRKSYELTVRYSVDGKTYERVVGALPGEFNTISIGDEIALKYKPQKPKKVVRSQDLNPRNVRVVSLIGGLLVAVGVILYFIGRI